MHGGKLIPNSFACKGDQGTAPNKVYKVHAVRVSSARVLKRLPKRNPLVCGNRLYVALPQTIRDKPFLNERAGERATPSPRNKKQQRNIDGGRKSSVYTDVYGSRIFIKMLKVWSNILLQIIGNGRFLCHLLWGKMLISTKFFEMRWKLVSRAVTRFVLTDNQYAKKLERSELEKGPGQPTKLLS